MERKFEAVIERRDEKLDALKMFVKNRRILEQAGFNEAQIESMEKERLDEYNAADLEFRQAFAYLLEFFDLDKNEVPEKDETVYVVDDYDGEYIAVEITNQNGEPQFVKCLHIYERDRYHIWTRLPKPII